MAIAIRSEGTGGVATDATDGTFVVTKPSSVADGDYLVVVVGKQDEPVIAPPAGWTEYESGSATGNDRYGGIFYKKITNAAGEPASYTFDSAGTSEPVGWWIGALSGVDQTTPEDVAFSGAGAWAALANDTSPNCPAVTTVTNGAFALACWAINTDSDVTMPGGSWADRAKNVGLNGVLSVASQTFPTAGTSTGTPEVTNVDTGMESMVGMFVFRPTVSVTPTPNVSDTVGTSESKAVTVGTSQVSKSETIGTSETTTASFSHQPSATDGITVVDQLGTYYPDTVWVTEEITVVVLAGPCPVNVSDTIGTAEATALAVSTSGISVSDTVGTAETVAAAIQAVVADNASASDAVGTAESVALTVGTSAIAVSDSIALAESVTVSFSLAVAVGETVGTSESVTLAIGTLIVTVGDSASASDVPSVAMTFATLIVQDCIHSHWADGPLTFPMPGEGSWTMNLFLWKKKKKKNRILY